jgi:pimeloyl-ACP methyl ester carboxylesterase
MDWWDADLCRALAAGGRRVIRYDNRDTGQSTNYAPGKPGYTGADLTTDALAVLDGHGIEAAHIAGVSMGGAIAQDLAVAEPQRVLSLTLIATSPIEKTEGLPSPEPRISKLFASPPPSPDWTDREAVIEFMVKGEENFSGSLPLDRERLRAIAGRAFDRTRDVEASQTNHWILPEGPRREWRLSDITAPTLVMHGTEDPLFPFAHGEAIARMIRGAELIPLEGMGHQMPPPQVWPVVVPGIVRISS